MGHIGAQARANGGGASADPFAKRLNVLVEFGVTKFTEVEGVITVLKWIVHAKKMVVMVDSMLIKRACRELINHLLTGNSLAW